MGTVTAQSITKPEARKGLRAQAERALLSIAPQPVWPLPAQALQAPEPVRGAKVPREEKRNRLQLAPIPTPEAGGGPVESNPSGGGWA